MKKYLSMAALLMSGFMFLTACSSDDDSSSSSSSSSSSKVVSSGTSAAEVVAQAQQNGSVTVNATSTSAVAATVTISSDAVTGAQGLDNGEVSVNVQQTDGNGYTVSLQPTSAVFSTPVEVALPVSDPDGTIYTYTVGGQAVTATVSGGLLKASVLSFNNQLVFTKQAASQGQFLGGFITGLLEDNSRGDIPMPYMHRIEFGADGNFTMYEFQNAQGNMMVRRRQGTFAVEGDTILALNVTSFDHTPHYGTEDTEWYGMSDDYEGESLRLPFAFRGENVSVMTPDGWETFVPEATVASSNTVVGRRILWMSYFNENTRQVQREERVIFDIKDNGQMTISIPVWNGEKWEGTYTTNGQTLSFRVSSVTIPSWEVEGTYSVITRDQMSESDTEGYDFTTPYFFDADGNLYAGVVGLFGVFEK